MPKILCVSCSKQIKVPLKYLHTCRSCHKPVCKPCSLDGFCRECGLFLDRNTILEEYFADKYSDGNSLRENETKKESATPIQY